MLNAYQDELNEAQEALEKSRRQINLISSVRLLLGFIFAFLVYQFFKEQNSLYLAFAGVVLILFFILIKAHGKYAFRKRLNEALVRLNKEEIEFISERKIPFRNGANYVEANHVYAQDLDIFGDHSLFQYLNRTHLKAGSKHLSSYLLNPASFSEIKDRQEAIIELNDNLEWRQKYTALCITTNEKEDTF